MFDKESSIELSTLGRDLKLPDSFVREASEQAIAESHSIDEDDIRLEGLGYIPQLRRSFTIWSLLGVGFGLTNSWWGISASLVAGISSGGPLLILYGLIIAFVFSLCIGGALSELISAFPESSAGQYYWTLQLAPPKYKRFSAYMCGYFSWFGVIFSSAAITLSIATAIVGMYVLGSETETFEIQRWNVFICFEVLNVFLLTFNIWEKPLPFISASSLYISLLSFVVISIVVLVCSRDDYQTARFVFVEFNNATGWSNSGIAFIVGLINPTWAFAGLDCATHMAEEIHQPERNIPIAIMGTIFIGFITAFCYSIAMFFSIRNLESILKSNTGVPILDIFYQSLQNKHGALFLEVLIIFTGIGCAISCHTWQSRVCWSFSRDNGILGSKYWSKVSRRTGLPINAHFMSCFWSGVIGCIYLGSDTAYNSVVTASITFLYMSYSIPIIWLLVKGRNNLKHGVFWFRRIGYVFDFGTLAWTLFNLVFLCFPTEMPVEAGSMNYSSIVLVVFSAYPIIYWFVRGRKVFVGTDSIHSNLD